MSLAKLFGLGVFDSLFSATISFSISLTIAFIIIVWFGLTLISGSFIFINILFMQPFVGWIFTGNINTNINDVWKIENFQTFQSPFFSWIVAAFIFSLVIFLIVLLIGYLKNRNNFTQPFKIAPKILGSIYLSTFILWTPIIYSVLGLLTGLMVSVIFPVASSNTLEIAGNDLKKSISSINLELNELKSLLKNYQPIDLTSEDYLKILNNLPENVKTTFESFAISWNNFINLNLNEANISSLQEALNNFNLNNEAIAENTANIFSNWSFEIKFLDSISNSFGNNVDQINSLISNTGKTIQELNGFINNQSSNLFMNSNLIASTAIKKDFFTNSNSYDLVNFIYRIILNDSNAIFNPGWSNPGAFLSEIFPPPAFWPVINFLGGLGEIIRILGTGIAINLPILTGSLTFAFLLLKRFVYLFFWPFIALFVLTKTGEDDLATFYNSWRKLLYTFIEIFVLYIFWNLLILTTTTIYEALLMANFYKDLEDWSKSVIAWLTLAGIMVAGFVIANETIKLFNNDREWGKEGSNSLSSSGTRFLGNPTQLARSVRGPRTNFAGAYKDLLKKRGK